MVRARGLTRAGPLRVAAAAVVALAACGDDGSPPGADAARLDPAAFADPPPADRPWARWWWPGDDVEEAELRRQVQALADVGLGGLEIQAFDAGLPPDDPPEALARRRAVDTPSFYAHVAAAVAEAASRGLEVDLTLGSGWPTGGPHVPLEASLQSLVWSEHRVVGRAAVDLDVSRPDEPAWYTVSAAAASLGEPLAVFRPDAARLVAVVAAPVLGGARSEDPLDLTDQVALDPARLVVLTDAVDAAGRLAWEAPPGPWQVVAFHRMPDGEPIQLHAYPAEAPWVTDHLDAAAVLASAEHLAGARTGLDALAGAGLRGIFVDSFELKNERLFATDLLAEHAARRGYDLVPWLPAVVPPGADNHVFDGAGLPTASAFRLGPDDARAQHDYRQTVSELFAERFAGTLRAWASERGLLVRMQGYGLDVDVLAAMGAVDVPEAEQLFAGGTDLLLKMASSAAHLHGRPFASAETFVWAGYDHALTPTRAKAAVDKLFAAGIAHLVYHGVPYRRLDGFGEPGWHPFSSRWVGLQTAASNLGETSPWWGDLPAFNRYVARVQHALRLGEHDGDVLAVYPFLGFPASFARLDHEEPLFNGPLDADDDLDARNPLLDLVGLLLGDAEPGPRDRWLLDAWPTLEALHAAGYGWDWVGPASLRDARADDGRLRVGGRPWRAVVLLDLPSLPPDVAEGLADLAAAGVPVVRVGGPPRQQPGLLAAAEGDARVVAAMARLAEATGAPPSEPGHAAAAALAAAGVLPRLAPSPASPSLRHARRRLGPHRTLTFLANRTRDPLEASLTPAEPCKDATWIDPWTGAWTGAAAAAGGALPLRLPAFGSRLLLCGQGPAPPPPEASAGPGDAPVPTSGWTLTVEPDDVSPGAAALPLAGPGLPDWRDLEALRFSGGPGTYVAEVSLPADAVPARLHVDLGRVEGVADVTWDGVPVGRLLVPPFAVALPETIAPGPHVLAVRVTPPVLNRYVGLAEAGDPAYAHLAGRADRLAPAGLLGPVAVTRAAGAPGSAAR